MIIEKEDLEKYIDKLPVRKGCGGEGFYIPCACSGECQKIIGWIDKEKYTTFINNYISIKDFISTNYEKVKEEPIENREYKLTIHWIDNKVKAFKALKSLNIETPAKILSDFKNQNIYINGLPTLKNFLNVTKDGVSFIVHKKINNNWIGLELDEFKYLYE